MALPQATGLRPSYPNPFNSQVHLPYEIAGDGGPVSMRFYDMAGKWVDTLVDEHQPVGRYTATWSGRNEDGMTVGAGLYLVVLQVNDRLWTGKVVYIK